MATQTVVLANEIMWYCVRSYGDLVVIMEVRVVGARVSWHLSDHTVGRFRGRF